MSTTLKQTNHGGVSIQLTQSSVLKQKYGLIVSSTNKRSETRYHFYLSALIGYKGYQDKLATYINGLTA